MAESEPALISIIVPFYNVKKEYFDRCFDSIHSQTFTHFEVIVVDDGSKEGYSTYLDKKVLEDRRFKVVHQDNGGVSLARNKGMSIARGETICFVDADDYMATWAFELMWKAYKENGVDAVASYYDLTENDTFKFVRNNEEVEISTGEYFKDVSLIGMNCKPTRDGYLSAGPVAVLFKSEIAKKIDFPPGIKYMEDTVWNYRYYSQCRSVAILHECIYAYRQNNESATHAYSMEMIYNRIKALKVLRDEVKNGNEWFALRVLANYAICCKCYALNYSQQSFGAEFREVNKDSIWNAFKEKGIAKNWDRKQRIKRCVAISGLMPWLYRIKTRRK